MKRFLGLLLLVPAVSYADSIQFNDTSLNHVYILESKTFYFVNNPVDGSITNVRKTETKSITFTKDTTERNQLIQTWHEARGDRPLPARPKTTVAIPVSKPSYRIIEAKGTRRASPQQTAQAQANVRRIRENHKKQIAINPPPLKRATTSTTSEAGQNSGGGNTGGGGGAQISNISQLFSTFDDRLVGEFPNHIARMTQNGNP